ncbi:pilus assembly protein CpaE [Nocardioides sp. KIGAM211]|uniref:Pilus assembly protein CpaE n=1 Tax=Nocardioides luti TaxID=2761101 RepID=A0A7X0RIK1_9ACTN|nr:pilus assembly protein CpaE [Nocardioides luti]MBB6628817.1 pilus assembly protein CpaE [Nocardioides luti]
MLTRELAVTLRDAGLAWDPANGDRFVVPDRDLDDQVFVLSDMVIELLDAPGGDQVLAFNGTTEWALDSLEASDAIWVPREDQLRDLLGEAFVSLERLAGPPAGYAVTVRGPGGPERHVDVDVECAYGRALVSVQRG